MSLVIICSHCSKNLRVPQELCGKSVKCPACGNLIEIPVQHESTTTLADGEVADWLAEGEQSNLSAFATSTEKQKSVSDHEHSEIPTELDPYYFYLGISTDGECLIDHYALLGLKRFESYGEIIEMAADRQMGHLQRYESGKHGEQVAKLMSEVSRARLCLLAPKKKSAYDEQLRSQPDADSKAKVGSGTTSIQFKPLGEQESQGAVRTTRESVGDSQNDSILRQVYGTRSSSRPHPKQDAEKTTHEPDGDVLDHNSQPKSSSRRKAEQMPRWPTQNRHQPTLAPKHQVDFVRLLVSGLCACGGLFLGALVAFEKDPKGCLSIIFWLFVIFLTLKLQCC